MLEKQDLQKIGQVMDQKLEELAGIVKAGFDRTATKEDIEIVKNDLNDVQKTVSGIDFKLKRHLEISDDRHFDHKRLHKVYEKWFDQIAQKVGVELEMPEPYRSPLESQ